MNRVEFAALLRKRALELDLPDRKSAAGAGIPVPEDSLSSESGASVAAAKPADRQVTADKARQDGAPAVQPSAPPAGSPASAPKATVAAAGPAERPLIAAKDMNTLDNIVGSESAKKADRSLIGGFRNAIMGYSDMKGKAAASAKVGMEFKAFSAKAQKEAAAGGKPVTDADIEERFALSKLGGGYARLSDIYGREVTDPATGQKTVQKLDRARWYSLAETMAKATGKLPNALVQPGSSLTTNDCLNIYKDHMQDKVAEKMTGMGYAKGVISAVFSGGKVPRSMTDKLIGQVSTPEFLADTRTFMANTMTNAVVNGDNRAAVLGMLSGDQRKTAEGVLSQMDRIGYSPKQLQAILGKTLANTGDGQLTAMLQDAAAVGISSGIRGGKADSEYTDRLAGTAAGAVNAGAAVNAAVGETTDRQLYDYIVNSGEDGKRLQTLFRYLPPEKRSEYMRSIRGKIRLDPKSGISMEQQAEKIKSDVSGTVRESVMRDPSSWRALVPYWFASKGMTGVADFADRNPVVFYGGALLALLCIGGLLKMAIGGLFGGGSR